MPNFVCELFRTGQVGYQNKELKDGIMLCRAEETAELVIIPFHVTHCYLIHHHDKTIEYGYFHQLKLHLIHTQAGVFQSDPMYPSFSILMCHISMV